LKDSEFHSGHERVEKEKKGHKIFNHFSNVLYQASDDFSPPKKKIELVQYWFALFQPMLQVPKFRDTIIQGHMP